MEAATNARKILIIDDEPSTLSMLRLLLGALGFDVITADSGETGLELFAAERPSIVLTDIRMPKMDGIEVLNRVKQIEPDAEVIMVTGHGDMDLAVKALQAEASDFINKPVQKQALEVALQRAQAKMDMRAQLRQHTDHLEEKVREATRELANSCRQVETLWEMSQAIGETASLNDILSLLRERIESATAFRGVDCIIFDSRRNALAATTPFPKPLAGSEQLAATFGNLSRPRVLTPSEATLFPSVPADPEGEQTWAVPLTRRGEPPAGVALFRHGPGVLEEQLHWVALLAAQTAGAVRRAMAHLEEVQALRDAAGGREKFGELVGRHESMRQVYKLVTSIAESDAGVLIQGESGTGKELVARHIHELSPRRDKPFVAINCAAYPQTLLEAELFGYEKGAFTGATHARKGSFEAAHEGTIFLDEVGEIPVAAQVKLLRVIQFREFQRLGSEATVKVSLRVLAATSKNLRREMDAGNFREDLFYRLNVIPITLPPLRERMSDLQLLVMHFLQKFGGQSTKKIMTIRPAAMALLMNHHWPGNIRELENAIEHAFILATGDSIDVQDLPPYIRESLKQPPGGADSMAEHEKQHLVRVLQQCNGNKIEAAKRLKIGRSTLYRKLEQFGLK